MTFKYSYEECLACEYSKKVKEDCFNFECTCTATGNMFRSVKTSLLYVNCVRFKPKGEVKMEKFCETCKHLYSRENEEPCTNCKNNYLLKWEPMPEKKKITIYMFKHISTNEICVQLMPDTNERWLLIDSIEREYEI